MYYHINLSDCRTMSLAVFLPCYRLMQEGCAGGTCFISQNIVYVTQMAKKRIEKWQIKQKKGKSMWQYMVLSKRLCMMAAGRWGKPALPTSQCLMQKSIPADCLMNQRRPPVLQSTILFPFSAVLFCFMYAFVSVSVLVCPIKRQLSLCVGHKNMLHCLKYSSYCDSNVLSLLRV